MAGGARGAGPGLLLRPLRICEHYGPRHGDVHSVPRRHSCGWRPGRIDRPDPDIFLKSERRSHTLRHNARARLFWHRLCKTRPMVDDRPDRFRDKHSDMVDYRTWLVEDTWLV